MVKLRSQPDLWSLVRGNPSIDPEALLAAVERNCTEPARDYRTRLLLRDASIALRNCLGSAVFEARLSLPATQVLRAIAAENLPDPGFPSLEKRMASATDRETILQFLRELGTAVHAKCRLEIGGASALILRELLQRATDDIDVVDQIPAAIRVEHVLLERLISSYGLRLSHFQSHYLPSGWESRVQSLGRFGQIDVFLIHPVDIFVGKLFSARTKDRDDLRLLALELDKIAIIRCLQLAGGSLLATAALKTNAEQNWYIVFGEPLPG